MSTGSIGLGYAGAASAGNLRENAATQHHDDSALARETYQGYRLGDEYLKQAGVGPDESDDEPTYDDGLVAGSLMARKVRMQVKSECRKTRVHGAYAQQRQTITNVDIRNWVPPSAQY